MFIIKNIFIVPLSLLVGNFLSTFLYHVLKQVFGKFYTISIIARTVY